VVLPALAFLMLGAAVYLAPGRRRETLFIAGLDLIAAGLFVLVARSIAGGYVVDQLTATAAVEPAAQAAWSIGTQMLRDIASATVVIGIPLVAAAWLAGPYRPAIFLRRAAAPTLRERPALVYSLVAVALLLVIAWDPIPATRLPVPVLVMIVLGFAAAAALRRQVAEEFPEVQPGETRAALQGHAMRAARAVQNARGAAPSQPVEQLERLSTLHDSGALSDEEFAEQKTLVLAHGNGSR
jgi:ABC-type multidrug transport system fused ATPase/permease subunit